MFAAQMIALLDTGLATTALGPLAWQLVGEDAGLVLGTALAIMNSNPNWRAGQTVAIRAASATIMVKVFARSTPAMTGL